MHIISHLPDTRLPKLAPLERLPKRHRVGPSASLDESLRNLFAFYNMAIGQCQIKNSLDSPCINQ